MSTPADEVAAPPAGAGPAAKHLLHDTTRDFVRSFTAGYVLPVVTKLPRFVSARLVGEGGEPAPPKPDFETAGAWSCFAAAVREGIRMGWGECKAAVSRA
jgi:hypothetical protein